MESQVRMCNTGILEAGYILVLFSHKEERKESVREGCRASGPYPPTCSGQFMTWIMTGAYFRVLCGVLSESKDSRSGCGNKQQRSAHCHQFFLHRPRESTTEPMYTNRLPLLDYECNVTKFYHTFIVDMTKFVNRGMKFMVDIVTGNANSACTGSTAEDSWFHFHTEHRQGRNRRRTPNKEIL